MLQNMYEREIDWSSFGLWMGIVAAAVVVFFAILVAVSYWPKRKSK
jgi:anti-sigma-K factor RskA